MTPKCSHCRECQTLLPECPRSPSLQQSGKERSFFIALLLFFPLSLCPSQSSTQGRREIPIFPAEFGLAPSLTGRAVAIDAAQTWFPVPLFLASEVRDLHVETSQKISN